MALSKSKSAITQMTASGTSTLLDVSASYGDTLYLNHSNGTGAVTTAGQVVVQVRPNAGARWYTLATLPLSAVAAAVDQPICALRDDVGQVQLVYTAPAGPTGFALDAEVGTIPSL